MKRLVFLLEEPSAEEMLKGLLPRILPDDVYPEYKVFEGKQDLERRLPIILRAWRTPRSFFVVMRDQDAGDCHVIKNHLIERCRGAVGDRVPFLIRIACRELESFYLGDLAAVEKGIGTRGIAGMQNHRKYREPDRIVRPSDELERLTNGVYQKVSGSRSIAPHLDVAHNRSHSFKVLLAGIRKLMEAR